MSQRAAWIRSRPQSSGRFLKTQLVERHGTTILFASHTLAEVEQLADRVVLLDKGRMLACDSPRGLRASTGAATLEEALERLTPPGFWPRCPRELHAHVAQGLAFFRRDVAIARSYRMAFALEILEAFFGVATFYYLSRFVSNDELGHSLPAGSDYFGFALVGFAFFDYLTVSMSAFDSSITEAQQNGTLEAMLVTETPLTMILVASAAYPVRAAGHADRDLPGLGSAALSLPDSRSQLAGGGDHSGRLQFWRLPGLGIISTSYLLLFKRGNPAHGG